MSDPRRDLRRSQVAAERAIDTLFRGLAPLIGDSVRRHADLDRDGEERMTPRVAARVLADVDGMLDRVYGVRRGAPSPLADLIVMTANDARQRAVDEAAEDVLKRVKRDRAIARAVGGTES